MMSSRHVETIYPIFCVYHGKECAIHMPSPDEIARVCLSAGALHLCQKPVVFRFSIFGEGE